MMFFIISRESLLRSIISSLIVSTVIRPSTWVIHDRKTSKTFELNDWTYHTTIQSTIVFNSPAEWPDRSIILQKMLQSKQNRKFKLELLDCQTAVLREGNNSIFAMTFPNDGGRWILTKIDRINML